ncbi:11530_t:CDS:1, partial [Scutellospora calospora]
KELVECAKVYANILEIGLFQYITYSHRSRKKVLFNPSSTVTKDEVNIEMGKTKVKWFVIPELMESYINSRDYESLFLEIEIGNCQLIENKLNGLQE